MADDLARLEIEISSSGVATANRRMDRMERSGRALERTSRRIGLAWKEMGVILAAIGFVQQTRRMIEMADQFKRATLLVGQFEESQAATAATMERLFRLSQKTRAEFNSTISIYQRFRVATQELGVSNEVLFAAIEGLQKSIVVAGVSAQEAQSAMIQLSQGMASGRLQGEELRSVLDGMPVVARAIADAAGVAFGDLRDAAAEGRIGVDAVLRAMVNLNQTMEKDFQGAAVTTDQAATRVGNALQRAVGLAEQAEGGTNDLAQALNDLAEAMTSDDFVTGIGAVMSFFGGVVRLAALGAQNVAGFISAIKALAGGDVDRALKLAGDNFKRTFEFFNGGDNSGPLDVTITNPSVPNIPKAPISQAQKDSLAAAQRSNAAIREETQAIMDGAKAWEEYKQARDISNEVDVFADDLKAAGATADQIKRLTAEHRFLLETQQEAIAKFDEQKRAMDFLENTGTRAFDRIGSAITEAYTKGSDAAIDFGSVARGVLSELTQSFIELATINPLKNALFGQSNATLSSVGGIFGSLFASGSTGSGFGPQLSSGTAVSLGFRAEGGPVNEGHPYIVGERGPELMVPSTSGTIIPNKKLRSDKGGMVVNMTLNNPTRDMIPEIIGQLQTLGAEVKATKASIPSTAIKSVVDARNRNPKLFSGA